MDNFNENTNINIEDNKDFYKLAQLVGDNIQKILQNVSSMNKILMRATKIQDAVQDKQNVRKMLNYTQQLTKDTRHNLKGLNEIQHSSPGEQMRFKIHKERLAERFKSALNEFEAIQCKVYDKENALMKLTRSPESIKILPPPSNSNHNDYLTFKGNNKNNQTQLEIQYTVDPKIIQRHQEIVELQNEVEEVNEIYREFCKNIYTQSEMVDGVEQNVLESAALIDQGNEYLHQASQHRYKYRKRSCYLSVICTVIILIIIYYVIIK